LVVGELEHEFDADEGEDQREPEPRAGPPRSSLTGFRPVAPRPGNSA
jgi:hypothetical protein